MNTQSYPTRLQPNAEACVAIGDFIFDVEETHLLIVLPNAAGGFQKDVAHRATLDPIRISRKPTDEPRTWFWNGNREKPTLSPSILWPGHWHGYLRDGRLQSC